MDRPSGLPEVRRRPRILAVDDDPLQLDLLFRGLTLEGFEVATHEGPIGVTNMVRAFQPDIVLLDLNIPSLRGDRLIELIRRTAGPNTKYFLLSASDESELRLRAAETSAHGWLSKSLPMNEIAHRLRAMLSPSSTGSFSGLNEGPPSRRIR
ncbi:response regulator [Pendulispora brunnea]|uniref:Response regulator n=1 Tax=Pendulispora brunnea TaxID=2905690 RepID=A0ABZ2K3Q6_9BACT